MSHQQHAARAAVFSGGSWGTAIAKVLADAGASVVVHARRPEIADAITTCHRNPVYWPDIELPASVTATTDPAAALERADYLVLSVPAQSLRTSLAVWAPHIGDSTVVVSLMKGIELGTRLRASEVVTDVTGVPASRVAVLSGPNLAAEIMAGQPAAATVACLDEDAARRFQAACLTPYFRPYTSECRPHRGGPVPRRRRRVPVRAGAARGPRLRPADRPVSLGSGTWSLVAEVSGPPSGGPSQCAEPRYWTPTDRQYRKPGIDSGDARRRWPMPLCVERAGTRRPVHAVVPK